MAKRKPVEIDHDRTDAETLRRVREWAEAEIKLTTRGGVFLGRRDAAAEVLAILNGTERKGKR